MKRSIESQRAKIRIVNKRDKFIRSDYVDYLKSKEWKSIRLKVIKDRNGKCENCNSTRKLQVHHLTYENLYSEGFKDLKLLCKKCHAKEHE